MKRQHTADSFFTFLLLLIFTLFALLLAGTGASVYRNGTAQLNENYTSRTAIAYVSEKVRQHDSLGDVFLSQVESCPALAVRDVIEGENFLTYIYYYDGALRELFVREDTVPALQSGSRIVELSAFEVEQTGEGFYSVTAASQEGNSLHMLIRLNAGNCP